MKQYITVQQLNELSDKGINRFLKWATNKKYLVITLTGASQTKEENIKSIRTGYFLPNIGQMIEFIAEKHKEWGSTFAIDQVKDHYFFQVLASSRKEEMKKFYTSSELCSGLWSVVKEILNK